MCTRNSQSSLPHAGVPAPHACCVQEKLGQGHFNATTTRVLHMVHNPAADAEKAQERAQLAELQSTNTALRATLQGMQAASEGPAGDEAAARSRAVSEAELAIAQHKVRPLLDQECLNAAGVESWPEALMHACWLASCIGCLQESSANLQCLRTSRRPASNSSCWTDQTDCLQAADLEKQLQRLKEVFSKQVLPRCCLSITLQLQPGLRLEA